MVRRVGGMVWQVPSGGSAERGTDAAEERCENCKMTIEREAFRKGDRTFCCDGCAYGGPCIC